MSDQDQSVVYHSYGECFGDLQDTRSMSRTTLSIYLFTARIGLIDIEG